MTDCKSVESTQLLEVKELSVNYGGIQALQNVNLTVKTGEVVTLIGAKYARNGRNWKARM